jgi:hypothetical protein
MVALKNGITNPQAKGGGLQKEISLVIALKSTKTGRARGDL